MVGYNGYRVPTEWCFLSEKQRGMGWISGSSRARGWGSCRGMGLLPVGRPGAGLVGGWCGGVGCSGGEYCGTMMATVCPSCATLLAGSLVSPFPLSVPYGDLPGLFPPPSSSRQHSEGICFHPNLFLGLGWSTKF